MSRNSDTNVLSFIASPTCKDDLDAVVWLVIGLTIYFFYSRHHSRLARPAA